MDWKTICGHESGHMVKEASLLLLIISLLQVVETCGGDTNLLILIFHNASCQMECIRASAMFSARGLFSDLYIKEQKHKDYGHSINQTNTSTNSAQTRFAKSLLLSSLLALLLTSSIDLFYSFHVQLIFSHLNYKQYAILVTFPLSFTFPSNLVIYILFYLSI